MREGNHILKLDKKLIQKRRIMKYFIEAAYQLIEEEGLELLTIRKVADLAGYNSATLYNYFENLDNLVAFASLKHLKAYSADLPKFTKDADNSLERYFKIWECYCHHSFSNPKQYHKIFFEKFSNGFDESLKEYYSIFPRELTTKERKELHPMLLKHNINERNIITLRSCAEDGFFNESDLYQISDISILIYQGMLDRIINGLSDAALDESVKTTISNMKAALHSFIRRIEE